MADRNLNCRQLQCPGPLVMISKVFKEMEPGQTLSVEADDPAFKSDIVAWIQMMGHELVEFSDGPVQQVVLRKS